jgi:hypothetical protein
MKKEFKSLWNYAWALVRILGEEIDERLVKKIKKLETKKARVFLKKWRALSYARRDGLRNLRLNDVEGCNQVIILIYQEYRYLGKRIP